MLCCKSRISRKRKGSFFDIPQTFYFFWWSHFIKYTYLLISAGLACTWNAGPLYSQPITHPSRYSKQKISAATRHVKKSGAGGRKVGNLHVLGVGHLNPPKKTVHGFKATIRNLRAKHAVLCSAAVPSVTPDEAFAFWISVPSISMSSFPALS